MEVILSTAFGVKTAAQTNPNDELMKLGRSAMGEGLLVMSLSLIPIVGTWLSQTLANSRYGLSFGALADVARKIIEERKAHGNQRKVRIFLEFGSCHQVWNRGGRRELTRSPKLINSMAYWVSQKKYSLLAGNRNETIRYY